MLKRQKPEVYMNVFVFFFFVSVFKIKILANEKTEETKRETISILSI